MDAEPPGLPASLRSASTSPFVGRSAELEMLRSLMPRLEGENRRVALIAGEPGAGKSRLVRELAMGIAAEGALVLYGGFDAAVRAPYGPFVEALDRLLQSGEIEDPRSVLGAGGGELIRLLPELPGQFEDLTEPAEADPDTERHRLHLAVGEVLANAAEQRPLLLVLEDGHWADSPSLGLLRHLAKSAVSSRVLVVMTFRDAEADLPTEFTETLAELRRSEDVTRIRLAGLSEEDVADLLARAAGIERESSPELESLAETVHQLTAGNAFLVWELWRALIEAGTVEIRDSRLHLEGSLTDLGTPDSVGEVVSQRLSRLSPTTTQLLELAATAGPEFELDPIRRAADLSDADFRSALEEALASGMIEEFESQRLSARFSHEIVRRALYDRLSRLWRAELHLRVGEAIEARDTITDRDLADLAHHFGSAVEFGGAERAIEYNLRAARAASATLAFDEAATRLRSAIEFGISAPLARADALLELGAASHRAGAATDALEAFREVAQIAREHCDADLLARAAVGCEEACWRPGSTDREVIELLEEALGAVEEDDEATRIGLLSGLARGLGVLGDGERSALVRENALTLARADGDARGVANILIRSYWARSATPPERILAMLSEAGQLAASLGDAETETEVLAWRVPTLVSLCDIGAAQAELSALDEMAKRTAQPFMHHIAAQYGSALALCAGDFARAEALAESSSEWGQLRSAHDGSGAYGVQMFGIRREQGRLAELAPAVRVLAAGARRQGPWRPGLIAVLAELGMEREAKEELSKLSSEGIEQHRQSLWLATLVYLTDACTALGDEETAARLYPEMEPYLGANVMIGHLVACYGAADRYLGMLAATLGEAELAERHFESAMELNKRMDVPTWTAHTAYEHGRFLLGQGRERRTQATELLADAAAQADRIGMEGLLSKVRVLGVAAPEGELPAGLSPREAQILALVARGMSNREIGEELTISEHTAANHLRSILSKTNSANRTEAASFAHRHGLASA